MEYERRWDTDLMKAARRTYSQPRWRGQRAETGRSTLLLHAEQGMGDVLQFCRYAPLAAERGHAVVLEVYRPLLRLLHSLPGVAEGRVRLVATGDPLPPFDLHCPLMSLPLAFGTTLDTVPAATPYLAADPTDLSRWRDAVAAGGPGLKIGLAWAGNPKTSVPDRRRSIDPTLLAPLADVPGVRLFSLQKEGAAPAGLSLTDLMGGAADFADTAALISQLDLVISVDTAVAHLAGALGRPVWLLNRFDTDWRWLLGRDDSPWYPTLRQFRQTSPGDWQDPIARACDALARWVQSA
ncbi:glycosyltransferase family 9 protein [Nitrospirillum amazonense]|nr:glycosyltransferase family 9 protein [Nitrospirillum amazonense]MEC4593437.1 glycosyltransferase family 9 protein [Nitrospirillum amazonense]